MRILFKPLARYVATETAAQLAPAIARMEAQQAETRELLADLQARLGRLLAVVERIEAERPGWLGAQKLSDLDQNLAWFSLNDVKATVNTPVVKES